MEEHAWIGALEVRFKGSKLTSEESIAAGRCPWQVRSEDDVLLCARSMHTDSLAPVFLTSSVTGVNAVFRPALPHPMLHLS